MSESPTLRSNPDGLKKFCSYFIRNVYHYVGYAEWFHMLRRGEHSVEEVRRFIYADDLEQLADNLIKSVRKNV